MCGCLDGFGAESVDISGCLDGDGAESVDIPGYTEEEPGYIDGLRGCLNGIVGDSGSSPVDHGHHVGVVTRKTA
jgi:hypothetical protein